MVAMIVAALGPRKWGMFSFWYGALSAVRAIYIFDHNDHTFQELLYL